MECNIDWWSKLKAKNPILYVKHREKYLADLRRRNTERLDRIKPNRRRNKKLQPGEIRDYNKIRADKLNPNRKRKPEKPSGIVHIQVPRAIQSAQWWRDLKAHNPEEYARRNAIKTQRQRERRARLKNIGCFNVSMIDNLSHEPRFTG